MLKRYAFLLVALILCACSKPTAIQFGANPTEDLQKDVKELKELSPEDRNLISSYIAFTDTHRTKDQRHPASGKTVEQVLKDAKIWNQSLSIAATAERLQQDDAKRLAAKEEAERNFLRNKVAGIVAVSFVKRTISSSSPGATPAEPVVQLEYDIENKGGKPILALKGRGVYTDPSGKLLVDHPLESDKTIAPGGRVHLSVDYKVPPEWREMRDFVQAQDGKFSFTFRPEALILEGGETLTLPQKPAG